jgi:hypothetical protein
MNRRILFKVFLFFLILIVFTVTCKKIELIREILVQTDSYSIGTGTVQLNGTIVDAGEGITGYGFYISESSNPQSGGHKRSVGSSSTTGSFNYNETELQGGKTYHFQAYAEGGDETKYGDVKSFSTADLSLSTLEPTILSKTSAILNGNIDNLGFEAVTEYGFYWSLTDNPQGANKLLVGSTGSAGAFSTTLSGLTIHTDYYYVAYAINNTGTKYGNVKMFNIENIWLPLNNFSGAGRTWAFAFSIDTMGFIGGGSDDGNEWFGDLWQYNAFNDNWTEETGSPETGTAFTIGNKAYVFDGVLYQFDLEQSSWTEKTPFPGTPRDGVFAFGIGDKGYIGSGRYWETDHFVYLNDVWEFDPKDPTNGTDVLGNPMGSWTMKADFPGEVRWNAVGFSIANNGYVCSGYNETSGNLSDLWEFDPLSTVYGTDLNGNPMGEWTQKTNYPGPPDTDLVCFIIANRAYVFNDELWQYNTLTDSWTRKADFPGQLRHYPVGFAIRIRGYMGTGLDNNNYLNDFWEYIPDFTGF